MASPAPDSARAAAVAAIPDDPAPSSGTPAGSPSSTSRELVMSPDRMGPDRLYVPSLGIYASLDGVKFSSGSLDIPREPWRVGRDVWSAPLAAGEGTTLLAGHVDLSGTPGALARLSEAHPGALVHVTDGAGRRSTFVTTSLQSYSKVSLPRSIFRVDGPRQLALVTCGGPVMTIDGEQHYRDNVVLTAVPASG